jgi:hypothetical protein
MTCASCGASMPDGAAFCPACAGRADTPPPATPAATGGRRCQACGNVTAHGAGYCGKCGEPIVMERRDEGPFTEYHVESMWTGYFGGYGSESYIRHRMNQLGRSGWRLIRTETQRHFWWWWLPRIKLLAIYERDVIDPGQNNGVRERR